MADIGSCLAIAGALSDSDSEFLLATVDEYIASGVSPAEAQRAAAADLEARIAGERADAVSLVGDQFAPEAEGVDTARAEPPQPQRQSYLTSPAGARQFVVRDSVTEEESRFGSREAAEDWIEGRVDAVWQQTMRRERNEAAAGEDADAERARYTVTDPADALRSAYGPGFKALMTDEEFARMRGLELATPGDRDAGFEDVGLRMSRREGPPPAKTQVAYKLFRVDPRRPGGLFPLFIGRNEPVEIGVWYDADNIQTKGFSSRPGWHAGDIPVATHIGEKSAKGLPAPDRRPANQVWAEVEVPDDVDWQTEANRRGTNAKGVLVAKNAEIKDAVPVNGMYRYKTNPNMTGSWIISGSLKVNRLLSDDEVREINARAGVADLPRAQPFDAEAFGFGPRLSRVARPRRGRFPNEHERQLMAEIPHMRAGFRIEFDQRLTWLSEGMLRNHMESVVNYRIDQSEIDRYRQYKEALSAADSEPQLSRTMADDMQAQADWLQSKAAERGFADIDALADADFDGFMALAEQWRNENSDVPWAVREEPALARAAPRFRLPTFGAGSMVIEALQNRYNRWSQVVEAVRAQGGVVDWVNDFFRAEERYWGRVSAQIEDFKTRVDAFVEAVASDGLNLNDVSLYAYAKHAIERNAHMRAQRETGRGGWESWSGMTDEEARDILDDVAQSGLQAEFDRHHATLMSWTQGTRDALLDGNLIRDDQYMTLNGMYDFYVPLKGNAALEGESRPRLGQGFNIRGSEIERARGRYSRAENVIENIVMDRVRALTRSGKNEVLRSFLKFVLDNPDSALWQVSAVEQRPVFSVDQFGNQVIEEEPRIIKDDRTIAIKDGGREVYVLVNDEKLREQMRNLNVEQVGKGIGFLLATQRMLSRMYTSLNPVFTVLNWARDVQHATIGMVDEIGIKAAAKLWTKIPVAVGHAFQAEFGAPPPMYQLYRAAGGKTGFFDHKGIEDLAKDMKRSLANAERSAANPMFWGPKLLELVEKVNAGIENSTRYAAFLASMEELRGQPGALEHSGSISKNLTVNFNRRGTWTPQLSAFILFFNPAMQGMARVAQNLSSPKALAVLGSGMAGVAMLALQNASMGDDDDGVAWWDKIPDETKDRNLIILLPPKVNAAGSKELDYIKVPMPYGLNWFATIARTAVDVFRNAQDPARGTTPTQAMKNIVVSFLQAYIPAREVGTSLEDPKSLSMAATPSIFKPVLQSALNMNAFGRPMYPSDRHNDNLPDATKFWASQAGTIFQKAAEQLNAATGGTAFTSGLIDVTPATIENVVRSYGGGPASFMLDMANMMYARQSIERPDLDVRRAPFVKQLYGRIDAETDRMTSYERMDKITAAHDPVAAALRHGNRDLAKQLHAENPELYRLGEALSGTRSRLSDIRKRELSIIASSDPDSVKFARLQSLNEKKRQVLHDLNQAHIRALHKAAAREKAAR